MAKAKMTGLGKGLDVLFGGAPLEMQTLEEENTQPEETADSKNLKTLRITEVEPNRETAKKKFQPRIFGRAFRIYKNIWNHTTNCSIKRKWILCNYCRREKMESC